MSERPRFGGDVVAENDVRKVAEAGRDLPPAQDVYIEDDYVINLMATVLDYQMNSKAVEGAIAHFKENRFAEIRTLDDLDETFDRFEDTKEGNTSLAQYLWAYNLWTRVGQLRGLASYLRSIGVVDQPSLRRWAERSDFKRDFEGRVKGLGPAVYQWLVMRQGVETVKPDVHVRRFAEGAVGRGLDDTEVVEVVERAARELGISPLEFDWRIWEWSRSGVWRIVGGGG